MYPELNTMLIDIIGWLDPSHDVVLNYNKKIGRYQLSIVNQNHLTHLKWSGDTIVEAVAYGWDWMGEYRNSRTQDIKKIKTLSDDIKRLFKDIK